MTVKSGVDVPQCTRVHTYECTFTVSHICTYMYVCVVCMCVFTCFCMHAHNSVGGIPVFLAQYSTGDRKTRNTE